MTLWAQNQGYCSYWKFKAPSLNIFLRYILMFKTWELLVNVNLKPVISKTFIFFPFANKAAHEEAGDLITWGACSHTQIIATLHKVFPQSFLFMSCGPWVATGQMSILGTWTLEDMVSSRNVRGEEDWEVHRSPDLPVVSIWVVSGAASSLWHKQAERLPHPRQIYPSTAFNTSSLLDLYKLEQSLQLSFFNKKKVVVLIKEQIPKVENAVPILSKPNNPIRFSNNLYNPQKISFV